MLKTLLLSAGIAFGVTFGAIFSLGMVGAHAIDKIGTAMEETFSETFHDDLEAFRECVQVNDNGDALATVNACMADLATWRASPTFKAEWGKLISTDSQIRRIIQEYNTAKEDMDSMYGRTAVNRCANADYSQKCVAAQYGE